MSDIRTSIDIPENTWVKVVNGKQSGSIRKGKTDVDYISLVYDAAETVDAPNNNPVSLYPFPLTLPDDAPTAAPMFESSNVEPVADPVPVYIWVACLGGKAGRVVVSVV